MIKLREARITDGVPKIVAAQPWVQVLSEVYAELQGRVLLTRTDTGKRLELGRGNRPVHVSGPPSELVLLLSGRDAEVAVGGEPEAVEAWRSAISSL